MLSVSRYALALAFASTALAVRWIAQPWVGDQLPFVTFFAAIVATAWYAGVVPAILNAALLYFVAYYFFIGPHYAFELQTPVFTSALVYTLAAGVLIALTRLMLRFRSANRQALLRALHTEQQLRLELAQRAQTEELLRTTQGQLAREVEDLTRLYDLSSRVDALRSLDGQLQAILECAAQVHGASRGLVSLYDGASGSLGVKASLGFTTAELATLEAAAAGCGACALAVAGGQRVAIENTDAEPRFERFRALARELGFRAVHSAPLVAHAGEMMGSLSVSFPAPHSPSRREIDQLELLARKAALYVQRAAADEARRESESRLREGDRRKDEFLAVLAHELRNPLAPIRNAVGFLQLKGTNDPDLANARDLIGRQVQHMVRLVDDLLDVSRVTLGQIQLQKEIVSLGLALTNAVEASRPLLDAAQHRLCVALPAEPIYVEADVTRLAQIFQNLLNNAAKYTPAGGSIEVIASAQAGRVRVTVRDNGIGIHPAMLERVFEMFTQVDRSGSLTQGGLGIGLSLAQQLARMHGGHIEARSAGEGLGSEFTVTLPMREAPATQTLPQAASAVSQRTSAQRRVLVVDDNVDAAESLRLVMETQGHAVRSAFDGEKALVIAAKFRPDIVFLDLGMPRMDGFAVCRRLRAETWGRGIVLVALTGWGQDGDRRRTAQAGFDHHVVKPADPVVVEQLIGTARMPHGDSSPPTHAAAHG
jgi:signal transduction histidine kinase/ActR/RegA family two-component response regulator